VLYNATTAKDIPFARSQSRAHGPSKITEWERKKFSALRTGDTQAPEITSAIQ